MSALVEQVERLDLNVGEVKPCGACHAGKGKTEFSSKQWYLKTDARRRCSECVASGKPLVEMAAAASPPTQPVGGGQWVPPPGPPPAPNPDYPDLTAEYEAEMGFHEINLRYPGLQLIHRNPLVNFLYYSFSLEISLIRGSGGACYRYLLSTASSQTTSATAS